MLTFKEDTHEYFWNGALVAGVSRIIDSCAPVLDTGAPAYMVERFQRAGEYGKAVHKCAQILDNGELDEYDYDPAIEPYLKGWKNFKSDIPAFKKPTVVDIKTGAIAWQSWVQLAAYTNLLQEKKWVVPVGLVNEKPFYSQKLAYAGTVDRAYSPKAGRWDRFIIQLNPKFPRGYKVREPKNTFAYDFNVFMAMLVVYREKEMNNALK